MSLSCGGSSRVVVVCFAIFVLAIAHQTAAAQDYTVTRTVFIPSVYYVGDQVEVRISLRSAFAKKMQVPQEFPQPNWGQLIDMRILPNGDEPEIRLKFISFAAGTRSLPSINLGPVVLEGVNIYVTSLIDGTTRDLAPLREQMSLPGTFFLMGLQILIILGIPALFIAVWIRGRPFVVRFLLMRKDGIPFRRLHRKLRGIAESIDQSDARTFYIRLLDESRAFLADRLRAGLLSATTPELETVLRSRVHDAETVDFIIAIFRHGDQVKFAGGAASVQTRIADLSGLEESLRHIEQEERIRRITELGGKPKTVDRRKSGGGR